MVRKLVLPALLLISTCLIVAPLVATLFEDNFLRPPAATSAIPEATRDATARTHEWRKMVALTRGTSYSPRRRDRYIVSPPVASSLPTSMHRPDTALQYSHIACAGPEGKVPVLGKALNHLHSCLIRGLCVTGDRRVEVYPPPDSLLGNATAVFPLPHTVYSRSYTIRANAAAGGAPLQEAVRRGRLVRGLTALVGSSYGQSHLTHFMEPLGQLFSGLLRRGYFRDHRGDGGGKAWPTAVQESEGVSYASLDRVLVAGSDGPVNGSWNEFFYTMLFSNHRDPRTGAIDFLPGAITSVTAEAGVCYEEVLLAGASYDPFEGVDMGAFRAQQAWFIAHSGGRVSGSVVPANVDSQENTTLPRACKVTHILISHRTSKRSIKDPQAFSEKIFHLAKRVGLCPVVREVYFGRLPPEDQAATAHWADVMIGVHGADLTNIVFMKPGGVLLELNPFLFFESRFFMMAASLGVHYLSWTCRRRACTTAGVWNMVVGTGSNADWERDNITERLRIVSNHSAKFTGTDRQKLDIALDAADDHGWFEWPIGDYVGLCLGCDLLVSATSMTKTVYSTQRDSAVTISRTEWAEIESLLRRVAGVVGTNVHPTSLLPLEKRAADAQKRLLKRFEKMRG